MFDRNQKVRHSLITSLLIVSLFSTWSISLWSPWAPAQGQVQRRKTDAQAHSNTEKKPGLSREKRTREMWVYHEANLQRLAQTHPLGLQALTADIANQDISDISVIQGDARLVTLPAAFDLNGQSVQFTPSGSSYTINTGSATYDTNLGTKLNLRLTPAVNPKSVAEAGDDAYLIQDLGFNFSFYGASYSSVAISSNGNLTFRPLGVSQADFDDGTVSSGETLAEFQAGLPRIAPYWHDLDATASATTGTNGIYLRRDSDRVVISWNNIRDFPNDESVDTGIHRFQATLFNNGRIAFTYASAQLTTKALVGISGGLSSPTPTLVTFTNPPANSISTPIAQVFSTQTRVD
ncbi:MAG: hypothetical protein M3X11_21510, partial [Acidobacteriota bacterium]|nr:hypothetical protein [Acidobacteriota bacterium]